MIYVLVTGSRIWNKPEAIHKDLNQVLKQYGPENIMIVTGRCIDRKTGELAGADGIAIQWAIENEIPHLNWPARWNHPKTAHTATAEGPKRNKRMVDWLFLLREWLGPFPTTHITAYAYPWGKSLGTRGTIELLSKADILYFVREYEAV